MAELERVNNSTLERYESWLSPSEHEKCKGFLVERRRREFFVGRCLARLALARETSGSPESFEFEADTQGKLTVRLPEPARSVHFNISHTSDVVVCATCRNFEVGIDVERVQSRVSPLLIAQRFFCEAEAEALEKLDEPARLEHFFNIWTLKEALAKAHGLGLAAPLESSRIEFSEDGAIKAESAYAQFARGAFLAITSPTPEHRLALCVLCDDATSVQISVQACLADSTGGEDSLTWALGRLVNPTG